MSETATEKKLTPRQIKAISALFQTLDVSQAAQAAGVNRSTFYRWVAEDSAFQSAMAEAEAKALTLVASRLTRLADKAVGTIEAVLDSKTATPAQKLRAAEATLSNLQRLREMVTIEQRLAALEKRISEQP